MVNVFKKVFGLLKALMLNFDEVQRLVFERLDELLNVRIAEDQIALAIKQVMYYFPKKYSF